MPNYKEFLTSSDSENGDSYEPKPKKKQTEAKPDSKKEAMKTKVDKRGRTSSPTNVRGGEYMFQIANMRYATVGEFRGKVLVGIREYYEKDGNLRPGKKGISLSAEQWQALKNNISAIDKCMKRF